MWEAAVKVLLEQGGFGYALAIVFAGLAWVLYKEVKEANERVHKANEACESKVKELYEKRLAEGLQAVQAMERSAMAMAALTASVEATKTSYVDLARILASIQQQQEARGTFFSAAVQRIEGGITAGLASIQQIQAWLSSRRSGPPGGD